MQIPEKIISRDKIILKTSIIGIITNVILSAFKGAIGFFTNSIAIMVDAINNISDALSSVITIIGLKLAGKKPDKDHPYGHGRIEYLTALTIGVIILYTGFTAVISSVKKIISPELPEYDNVSLIIIAVAVVVKLFLGIYTQKMGVRANSDSLIASGVEAKFDTLVSFSTLVAAFIFIFFGVSLEAYLGVIISLLLIKTAAEILKDTINKILGTRPNLETIKAIYKEIRSIDGVLGAYDLMFHDYGPDKMLGSVHIEVVEDMTAGEIDTLIRRIQREIFTKFSVVIDAVGIYALNLKNPQVKEIHRAIKKLVLDNEFVLQMHGFYVNLDEKIISFDMIIDFDAPDRDELYRQIVAKVANEFSDYEVLIALDNDYSG
ncbi:MULTISPECIES: cation diffusion facilitator family transporter [unclassified Campylobacter]|uniref:cation diffusion facilitator family transporter n=1 Tax=unclassified Campylobacter TaxID=2593542 RepID=UPI0022E9BAE8|nr:MULTISPECIES: cation diffusion facilitator family transporter [unclassified Campylobacter]MDA3055633.1 cation diffusion facilitator family transporter [Campylobacter sp. CN_NA1]MDA3064677.1 cation diffusion facilitator family transporter [Campylobacter sp. CN_NE4]MDA3068499.1 cation diffusion facilitator family transporter [Campylobacter sp. CN_NE3]MDA3082188.1 cation diffusion facilitator family transporter [Campylobacter sp. CN_EL2]MDA3083823.1 cation diffusion facilitator family transpor